jgi:hypothetical protein
LEERMNRKQISLGNNSELAEKDRKYWEAASDEE